MRALDWIGLEDGDGSRSRLPKMRKYCAVEHLGLWVHIAWALLLEVSSVTSGVYHQGPHHMRGFNNTFVPGKHSTTFSMALQRGIPCEMVCTNSADGVSCKNAPPYHMNRVNGSDHHRNIISHNRDHSYALGFVQFARGSFFLSIYDFSPSSGVAGSSIWTARGPGHFAHGVVVDEFATLSFLRKGILELRNSLGTLVIVASINALVMSRTKAHTREVS